jgi:hypothetical protein
MTEEEDIIVDVKAIGEKYEDKGYFRRLKDMFVGLGKPHDTPEYKIARTELQRQMAPLVAIVSVVLFFIVLVVVTAMTGTSKDAFEVTIAEAVEDTNIDEQVEEEPPDDIETPPMDDVDIPIDVPTPTPTPNATPQADPAEQVSVKPAEQDSVAFVDSPVKMKSMVGSRDAGSIGRSTSGGANFGDPTTEAAVMKALWWLKGTQQADGSWKCSCPLAGTALAVLTYLAHGEYPGSSSPYRKDFGPVVQKAINFLTSSIIPANKPGETTHMRGVDGNEYAFLIATYALCEAYGMTKNPDCKDAAMPCLERIIKGQSPTGGWDYKINPKSSRDDLSFAGWALQAVKAGKMAGLHPDGLDECINKAVKCLRTRSFNKAKGCFTYCAGTTAHPGLTPTGCLAMQLLGHSDKPEVKKALDFMREWHPTFDTTKLGANLGKDCPSPQYYCYYATQCKYQSGMRPGAVKGDEVAWQKWNAEMKQLYPKSIKELSVKVKDWTGKEHRQGYYENSDSFSTRPVMDTCLVALQLMVYYRYLPTTQMAATAVEDEKSAAAAAVDNSDVDVDVDI